MTNKNTPEQKTVEHSKKKAADASSIGNEKNTDTDTKDTEVKTSKSRTVQDKSASNTQSEQIQTSSAASSHSNGWAILALLVALISVGASGFLLYQNNEYLSDEVSVKHQLSELKDSMDQASHSQQAQIQSNQKVSSKIQQQSENIANYSKKIDQLEAQIDKFQQQLIPEKDRLLLARVRELVYQAQSIIAVSRQNTVYVRDLLLDVRNIIVSETDPLWDKLRQALVIDIDALAAANEVNKLTIFEQIEQVRRSIRSLEFVSNNRQAELETKEPEIEDNSQVDDPIETFANKIVFQLKNMVIIRKNEDGSTVPLSSDAFQHVKLLIESGLSQSQLGLLQQDKQTFEKSLIQIRQVIEQRLVNYQLDRELSRIDEILSTRIFDVPVSLKSYPVIKTLENELR